MGRDKGGYVSEEDLVTSEEYHRELIDNKATWQSECAAGVWFYYPVVPIEGQDVLLTNGGLPWLAVREGENYIYARQGITGNGIMRIDSVWAWAYIQTPRKG